MILRGLTQEEIVEEWHQKSGIRVSRSTIGMAIARYDLASAKPRPRYEETIPWRVKEEHKYHNDARMLRLEGRRRRGRSLNAKELRLLNNWRKALEEAGAVVWYNPESEEGFHWIPREPHHDDIIDRD